MRRIYFVVDLSLLRGLSRDAHLANLISVVARTYATYFQPDVSFGYKLFDSSCGDCAVDYYLQRVASELSKFCKFENDRVLFSRILRFEH
jgi:hypothetical protein